MAACALSACATCFFFFFQPPSSLSPFENFCWTFSPTVGGGSPPNLTLFVPIEECGLLGHLDTGPRRCSALSALVYLGAPSLGDGSVDCCSLRLLSVAEARAVIERVYLSWARSIFHCVGAISRDGGG